MNETISISRNISTDYSISERVSIVLSISQKISIFLSISQKISIVKWYKKHSKIDNIQHKRRSFRFKNTNDTSLCPLMETDLHNWIIAKREASAVLDSLAIKQKAFPIFNRISHEQNSILIHRFRNFCCQSLEIDVINHWSRFASF